MIAYLRRGILVSALVVAALASVGGCVRSFDMEVRNGSSAPLEIYAETYSVGHVGARGTVFLKGAFNDTTTGLSLRSSSGKVFVTFELSREQKSQVRHNGNLLHVDWDGRTLKLTTGAIQIR